MTRATRIQAGGPPTNLVDIWSISLDDPKFPHDVLAATLDARERQRSARMRVGGRDWSSTHGAVRIVLASYLDVPAATLRFASSDAGKPRLVGVAGLEFSFAHAEGLALLAVARGREVGVDVERENNRTDIDLVAREFLPPSEVRALERTPPDRRRSAFFNAWARHEARLKLHGQGLLASRAGTRTSGDFAVVRTLVLRPGFAGAVAAEGGAWTVRAREFPPATRDLDLHGTHALSS